MSSRTMVSSAEESPDRTRLSPLMEGFQRWTALYFVFSCLVHVFNLLVLHQHSHMVNPMALNRHNTFYDFTIFIEKFKLFGTADFFKVGFPINYPAPVCLGLEAFFKFGGPYPTVVFVVFSALAFLVPALLFARDLQRRGVSGRRASPAKRSWQPAAIRD